MDFDKIKQIWDQTDSRLTELERQTADLARQSRDTRRRTALESLIDRYKRFSIVGILLAVMIMMQTLSGFYQGPYGIAAVVTGVLLGCICSVMDRWLWMKLKGIDVSRMGVAEVSACAILCRRRHLQFICISVPMAFLMVLFILLSKNVNIYMIYGIISGALVGFLLGLRELSRFLSDYRTLSQD